MTKDETIAALEAKITEMEKYAEEGWSWVDDVCEWLGCGAGGVFEIKERIDALIPPEPSPVDRLKQGHEKIAESRPLVQPKQYGRRSAFDR